MTDATNTEPTIDPRPAFGEAVRLAGTVIAGVRPDQAHLPTPCDEFDATTMRGHLLAVLRRVAVIGRGGDLAASSNLIEEVPGDDWAAAWAESAAETAGVWADDAILTNTVHLPWTSVPGWAGLSIYVSEITVHTWDLAQATSQRPDWDDAVAELGLEAMHQAMPAEGRIETFEKVFADIGLEPGVSFPFEAAVDVSQDAPPIDRLVAYTGRRP